MIHMLQVRSVDAKEALRLQKENNFVILDVRPEAEFKEVFYRSPSHCISFFSMILATYQKINVLWCIM